MKKSSKIKIVIFFTLIVTCSYFLVNKILGDHKYANLKILLLSNEKRQLIKKYIFPYKFISQLEKTLSRAENKANEEEKSMILNLAKFELDKKETGSDITITESSLKLSNNKILKKYSLNSGFYAGINNLFPGSGYIDFFENKIFVLSSQGVLAFREDFVRDNDENNFKQIRNNIHDFIGLNQFKKNKWFSLKDLHIFNNQVFISYTEEIKKDCWNTSVIYGNINYKNIKFKKLFSPKKCIHSIDNLDKEFGANQSGGRIVKFDDNHILLTVGDYRSRHFAQDKKSVNGKIIKININNSDYKIISMGHRNPQGLYFDRENNFILETEHGPKGGDEINLIEVDKIQENKIPNYGWAVASYGEHYDGSSPRQKTLKFQKYPLHKSHSEHGFIEPLKAFVPAIAISEIVKIEKNNYVVSSMGSKRDGDKSLYFFQLNEDKQLINLEQVKVFERIRDLRFNNNKLYLFMENTASIGVINLN